MNKIGTLLIGIILGIILSFAIVYFETPSLVIKEDVSKYNFEETMTRLEEAALAKGWKVSAVHDLQATMAKFNMEVEPVTIVELCNPEHAGKVLSNADARVVSSMMPCRVAIYEKDGKVILSRMNSALMAKPFGGIVAEVMSQAAADNEMMINTVRED